MSRLNEQEEQVSIHQQVFLFFSYVIEGKEREKREKSNKIQTTIGMRQEERERTLVKGSCLATIKSHLRDLV